VTVADWTTGDGGIEARLAGEAALDFGLGRGLALAPAGRLSIGGGATRFFADGCFPVSAARLELGENDVETLNAELCPTDEPMLTIARGWRFRGEARALAASAPFLGMRVDEGRGRIAASDAG